MKDCSVVRRTIARILLVMGCLAGAAGADQICKARLDCPGNWHGDTAEVTEDVVVLDEAFSHCAPDSFNEQWSPGRFDTVSVMFVIDNSSSMAIMDSAGSRYDVVRKMIDSLSDRSPASEVGIVVFSNRLLHSYLDDPYYVQLLPDSGWPDSYIPLTQLDSEVNGVPAVRKLKEAIRLSADPADTTFGGNRRLVNSDTSTTGRRGYDEKTGVIFGEVGDIGGTDISMAFDAVRQAMDGATYGPDQQFVVFLSDGVAQFVDYERRPSLNEYMAGEDMPTTFTAYFVNRNNPIPAEIRDTMTANIRGNGYSSRNSETEVWKTAGTEDSLFTRVLKFIEGTGRQYYTSRPKSLTVNGVTTSTFDDSLAYFQKPFAPLQGEYTTLNISYTWHWDYPIDEDETGAYTVVVRRTASPQEALPTTCWEQATLTLIHGGAVVTNIDPEWSSLEVRLTPSSEFPITDAEIVVKNAAGSDSLVLTAYNTGEGYFAATFSRRNAAVKDDNILQNGANDSIVVIYRNPLVPLDTVTTAAPVDPVRGLTATEAYYVDRDADGYPDAIRVVQPADRFTARELALIQTVTTIDSRQRSIAVDSLVATATGFDIVLIERLEGNAEPFTGLYETERLIIDSYDNLPGGGSFAYTALDIGDSMAPVIVEADFLDLAPSDRSDTLTVRFSEEVKAIGSTRPFLFHREGDTAQYGVTVRLVEADSSTARFSVPPLSGRFEPRAGDSIRISTAAGIADTLGHRQLDSANARQELGYHKLYQVLSAAYSDTSSTPDGLIDVITVTMDHPPDAALLEALTGTIELPPHRSLSIDDIERTSTGLLIYVSQPDSTMPFTGVTPSDVLKVGRTVSSNKGLVRPTTVPIDDDMAPVVVGARFTPGFAEKEGTDPPDTITVAFSEPVGPIQHDYPLMFQDAHGGEYVMRLSPLSRSGSTVTFVVDTIEGNDFPRTGDLVWINPAAGVRDTLKTPNIQTKDSRPAVLSTDPYRYRFIVSAYPNPADPRTATVPSYVRTRTGIKRTKGVLVLARPTGVVAPHVTLKGSIVIYDAVGNIVVEKGTLKAKVDVERTMVAFVWDGTNRSGRYVGTGTYLAVVEITDSQDLTEYGEVHIGIQR